MNKIRIFNELEIKTLLKNKNILSIKYNKEIEYDPNFKLWAVQEKIKYPNKTAREIFVERDFDMTILDEKTPQRRLNSWIKKYKMFGNEYFYDYKNKSTYKAIEKEVDKYEQ
ncbi:MAG: hypothetical protein Q4G04_01430 [bacterium]|nr:hypothetical protein [bacterium]